MIYIHIPFCRTFCTYCGFYSELLCRGTREDKVLQPFCKALENEFAARKSELQDGPDTLYIGGGTPSVLPFSVLQTLASLFMDEGRPHRFREFTVEVNPEDIVSGGQDYAEGLLSLGVNRISMGVQSYDDGILRWMNRRHTAGGAVEAYRILRRAGVENISLDLIFGVPGMGHGLWKETLGRILDLPGGMPEHISAYQFSVEPGSALEKMMARGRCREVGDEECRLQYMTLCEVLGNAGYRHYEVSNFALPGYEAVHNSAYWSGEPYLGLGPGAHSFRIDGDRRTRSWNRPSVEAYLSAWLSCRDDAEADIMETEELTREQAALERIMLSLRTDTGLPEPELLRLAMPGQVRKHLSAGTLTRLPDGNVRIPESGFFISDSIIADIV